MKNRSFAVLNLGFLALTIALLLGACDQRSAEDSDPNRDVRNRRGAVAFKERGYTIIPGSNFQQTGATLSGSGAIVFNDVLDKASHNFQVNFSLKDGGSLKLIAFAKQDAATGALKDGVAIDFRRLGGPLSIQQSAPKQQEIDYLADDPNSVFRAHYLPANADGSPRQVSLVADINNRGENVEMVLYRTLQSHSHQDHDLQGKGLGNRWGLILDKATVTDANFGKEKHTPH